MPSDSIHWCNDPRPSDNLKLSRLCFIPLRLRRRSAGQRRACSYFATNPGQLAVTITDFSSWLIKTTNVTEMDVVNIKETQPVEFTLDAIPGKSFKGSVLSIARNFPEKQGDIVYEVTILLADEDPLMRWEMTAEIKFGR